MGSSLSMYVEVLYVTNPALVCFLEIVPRQGTLLTSPYCSFLGEKHNLIVSLHTNLHLHGVLVCRLIARAVRRHNKEKPPQTLIPESVNRPKGGGVPVYHQRRRRVN